MTEPTNTPRTDALLKGKNFVPYIEPASGGGTIASRLAFLAFDLERENAALESRLAAIGEANARLHLELVDEQARLAECMAALGELADLMQGVIDGDYKLDSFTLQPARQVLAGQRGEDEKHG